MPTYDYHCKYCNADHEVFHSMNAEPAEICPSCKKKGLEKVIGGGAGIIFKGSGFYETDYKRSGSKKEESTSIKSEVPKEAKKCHAGKCGCHS